MGKKTQGTFRTVAEEDKSGKRLEKEVERIHQLLGGNCKRRVLIKTYEIDVLTQFNKGPLSFAVIVECKEYSHDRRVSDSEMQVFVAKLLAARECGRAEKGVFVTTSDFTKNARATAGQHSIQCLTLNELKNQLVDFSAYSHAVKKDFSNSDLAKWYVPQTGSDVEDYDLINTRRPRFGLHRPLDSYVDFIFSKEKEKRIALLGNFGTGKSSFCVMYRNLLIDRYIRDQSSRIPILIDLREFRSGIDIHQVITNVLQRLPGVNIDLGLCLELQRMGRFFFILDGLDEMATRVDRTVVTENLREIDRLNTEGDNLYMVTCRTHFFQERIAEEFLRDYRVIYLTEWGPTELRQYLKNRFPDHWRSHARKIASTSGLEELSKTPLLLEMISRSIMTAKDEDFSNLNIAKLYDSYTSHWIAQQSKRRGAIMSITQRRMFAEKLAALLYLENRTDLHFSELYQVARKFSGYVDATNLDYFDTDVRTCTFITRDSKGNYLFRHRSFMEYFCAFVICREINSELPETFSSKMMTREIMLFLLGMEISERGFSNLQKWSKDFGNDVLSQNSTRLLLAKSKTLQDSVAQFYNISPTETANLLEAIDQDNASSLNKFVVAKYDELRRIAIDLAKPYGFDSGESDDLLQEVLLSMLQRNYRLGSVESANLQINNYFSQLVKNRLLDRHRLKMRRKEVPLEYLDLESERFVDQDSLYEELQFEKTWTYIEQKLKKSDFSEENRRVFIDHFKHKKSIAEIAQEMALDGKTVSLMISRTQVAVRQWILKIRNRY